MEEGNGFGGRSSPTARDHIHHHDQEFEEEDVWDFPSKASSYSTKKKQLVISSSSSSGNTSTTAAAATSGSRIISSAPRNIPRGSQTTANDDAPQQSSAPMNIPDWSKIYGKKKKIISCGDTTSWAKNHHHHHHHHHHHTADCHDYDHHVNHDHDDDDGDGDGVGIVPPHEWIAKRLARSQISSFSVCEGIGRTLKGRDLSKVRNAILTKTGFLE